MLLPPRTLSIARSLVCVLTTPTMVHTCADLLEALREQVPWRVVPPPAESDQERYVGYFRRDKKC